MKIFVRIISTIPPEDVVEEITICRVPVAEVQIDKHFNSIFVSLLPPFERGMRQIGGMNGVEKVELTI